ncbi:MAG: glycosyltransferase family 4 protein [Smithella sp.]
MIGNIVHLTSVHTPFDTRIFYKECQSLVEAGYQITLIAPHTHDVTVRGVKILALPSVRNRITRMMFRTMRIYRLAKQLNADIYHFHDPELIPVGLALRIGGHRVIYDVHEDAPQALLSPGHYYIPVFSKQVVSSLLKKLEKFAAPHFDACIAATPHIANRFKIMQENTFIINNYSIINELGNSVSSPWSSRKNDVVYVGGIAITRGLCEMVKAIEYLPDRIGARLKLVGNFSPPGCRVSVENLRGWMSVDELGYLDRKDIGQVLSQAKAGLVIIHPEQRYIVSQPTKLFEFMSAGIPVIISDFPLWRELIEQEGCGLVVDPLDPRAIASAIEYLLTHDTEAEEMGQRGRQAVEKRYNWSIEERKLLSLYNNVLSSAGRLKYLKISDSK